MLRKLSHIAKIVKWRRSLRHVVRNHILCLENRELSIWGSITENDERAIIELTRYASTLPGPIIEIGALFGFTTQLIATHKPTETELIAVENFSWNPFMIPPEDHRIITHRVLRYNIAHCNTHIFEGSSADFYRQYKGEVPAMVFIDACHLYEGVKEDIDWVVGLGVPVISGHDYCDLHEGVRRAVDEVFGGDITAIGSVWSHRS